MPFPEPPLANKYDEKYVQKILNKEKELKQSMKRKAQAASFRAKQEAAMSQRSSMYQTINLLPPPSLPSNQSPPARLPPKLEHILQRINPSALHQAKMGVLRVDRAQLMAAYGKMKNRHTHNHSEDRNFKIGKYNRRLEGDSMKAMSLRLQKAMETLQMDDKEKEDMIRR